MSDLDPRRIVRLLDEFEIQDTLELRANPLFPVIIALISRIAEVERWIESEADSRRA